MPHDVQQGGEMSRKNCWEFRKCGRETARPGDSPCPACTCKDLDGANGGRNAGRACWVAAGSMNFDEQSGQHPHPQKHCWMCDFFNAVREEEASSTAGFLFTRPAMEQAKQKEAPMTNVALEPMEPRLVFRNELEELSFDIFGSHAEEVVQRLLATRIDKHSLLNIMKRINETIKPEMDKKDVRILESVLKNQRE